MKKSEIYIGTSGWSYKHWKGIFYKEKMKPTDYLRFYAESFKASEINSSFYHLPQLKTVEGWVAKVTADFKFCPKISRYLTHSKRLHDPEEPLERFFRVFEPMKKMTGPVLVQLPSTAKFDPEVTEYFYQVLKKYYKAYNFAVEVRHNSWLETESIDLMGRYNIAFVISNSNNLFPYAEFVTSQNVYLRFHGPKELYASLYSNQTMDEYAKKCKAWRKAGHNVWVFFNNDGYGYALENSQYLKGKIEA